MLTPKQQEELELMAADMEQAVVTLAKVNAALRETRDYANAELGTMNRLFNAQIDLENAIRTYVQRHEEWVAAANKISEEVRAALKRIGPGNNPHDITPEWFWDECEWELALRVCDLQEPAGYDRYIAIVPLKNGRRLELGIMPLPSHQEWALRFYLLSNYRGIPDILIKGELPEVKRQLDALLEINTPEIPKSEKW